MFKKALLWNETLPSGYTRIPYIHTDGNAWFSTGIYGDENTSVEIIFRSSNSRSQVVFGARTSATSNAIAIFHPGNADTDTVVVDFGDYRVTRLNNPNFPINNWYRAYNSKSYRFAEIISTGVKYEATTEYADTVTTPLPLYLAYKSDGFAATNNNFIGDIKALKIWNNGVLAANYIPVIGPTNKVGMYDLVTNTAKYSDGESEFSQPS